MPVLKEDVYVYIINIYMYMYKYYTSIFGDDNFLSEFKPKNKVPNVSELILNISIYTPKV